MWRSVFLLSNRFETRTRKGFKVLLRVRYRRCGSNELQRVIIPILEQVTSRSQHPSYQKSEVAAENTVQGMGFIKNYERDAP